MDGWTGTILRIDLTEEKVTKESLPPEFAEDYLGGLGFGLKLLYDEVPPGTDPFDPEMIFVVAAAPLSGTLSPSNGRLHVITKSPLTGILGDSNAGAFFGPELKFAGYDAIVIKGRAKNPVYIFIEDDEVQIRDATHLWGQENRVEVVEKIRKEIGGPPVEIMDIGIGGENKVVYSGVYTSHTRIAASTGIGSVLGAKNMKAVAVRGTKSVKVADPDGFLQAVEDLHNRVKNSQMFELFSSVGAIGIMQTPFNEMGLLPFRNSQEAWMPPEEFEPISGETWIKRFKQKDMACFGCPVHCSHYYKIKDGPYAGLEGEGVEYGAYAPFSSVLGVTDAAFATKAVSVCDKYGFDANCIGYIIAFAAELFQRGIITKEDTDGIDLTWGNQEANLEMIRKIALREGFGAVLADGFQKAAETIGKGSEDYLLTINGRPPTSFDLRYGIAAVLCHITSTRGADHLKGMPGAEFFEGSYPDYDEPLAKKHFNLSTMHPDSPEGKEKLVVRQENMMAVANCVGMCTFFHECLSTLEYTVGDLDDIAKVLTPATGVQYDAERLQEIGERLYRFQQAYNAREGVRRKDFKLPRRFTEEKIPDGPTKGRVMDPKTMDKVLDAYFLARGMDPETALPTRKGLEEVGLEYIADDFEKRKII